MTDAQLARDIANLHALATQRRQTARLYSTTNGYRHAMKASLGIDVPEPVACTLARLAAATELAAAERIDASIAALLDLPSDAARRAARSNHQETP